jgi:hypothetical protein
LPRAHQARRRKTASKKNFKTTKQVSDKNVVSNWMLHVQPRLGTFGNHGDVFGTTSHGRRAALFSEPVPIEEPKTLVTTLRIKTGT